MNSPRPGSSLRHTKQLKKPPPWILSRCACYWRIWISAMDDAHQVKRSSRNISSCEWKWLNYLKPSEDTQHQQKQQRELSSCGVWLANIQLTPVTLSRGIKPHNSAEQYSIKLCASTVKKGLIFVQFTRRNLSNWLPQQLSTCRIRETSSTLHRLIWSTRGTVIYGCLQIQVSEDSPGNIKLN